jgi:hypothetical protein
MTIGSGALNLDTSNLFQPSEVLPGHVLYVFSHYANFKCPASYHEFANFIQECTNRPITSNRVFAVGRNNFIEIFNPATFEAAVRLESEEH